MKTYLLHEECRLMAQARGKCLHDFRIANPYAFGTSRSFGKIDKTAFISWLLTDSTDTDFGRTLKDTLPEGHKLI